MLKTLIQPMTNALRTSARHVLVSILLVLAACLMAVAGAGFLAAWVFLALQSVMGPELAAFLMGLCLLLVAAGLLLVASRRLPPPPSKAEVPPESNDLTAQMAFAIAFVLGRYLADDPRR